MRAWPIGVGAPEQRLPLAADGGRHVRQLEAVGVDDVDAALLAVDDRRSLPWQCHGSGTRTMPSLADHLSALLGCAERATRRWP